MNFYLSVLLGIVFGILFLICHRLLIVYLVYLIQKPSEEYKELERQLFGPRKEDKP